MHTPAKIGSASARVVRVDGIGNERVEAWCTAYLWIGLSVDGVGDRVKAWTYAAIAVKAPRYYTASARNSSKRSAELTSTLKMTATLRLLSDTMLLSELRVLDLRLDMLDGLIRTNAPTCNVLWTRWAPAPQHRNQGCEEMKGRASRWKELEDIPSPFVLSC